METRERNFDGLWTAEFGSSTGMFGGGVAVFLNGKILGGDATYFYIGEYRFKGSDHFEAKIKSAPFISGAASVFKTVGQELTLEISGSFTDHDHAIAQGFATEMPNLKFGVRLTRRG
jgi:hypothetical protein